MKRLKKIFTLLLIGTLVSTTQGTDVLGQGNAVQANAEERKSTSELEDNGKDLEQKDPEQVSESESESKTEGTENGEIVTEEIKAEEKQIEEKQTVEKQIEEKQIVEIEAEEKQIEGTESETSSELQMSQEGILANSWRFTDGVWTPPSEGRTTDVNAASISNAWKKINGNFYDGTGERILEGVLAKGIDVSEHQKVIDWASVKASDVEFAIIRCGYGSNYIRQDDKYWKRNADACTKSGIPFGTYIYSYAHTPEMAKSEAEHVLRLVKGYNLTYPIYFDLEDNGIRTKHNLTPTHYARIAQAFCDTIEAAGYKAAIYANKNWFDNYLTDPVFHKWDKWVAQYNNKCDYTGSYSMWQCTSKGTVPGIIGRVDINMLYKKTVTNIVTPVTNIITPIDPQQKENINNFVTRLYNSLLERAPEEGGLIYWTNVLIDKKATGAETAVYFLNSKEMKSKKLTDTEYVNLLYASFLGRTGESEGVAYWLKVLAEYGFSRTFVAAAFVHSPEFGALCTQYGITRGTASVSENRDKNTIYTKFVSRLYKKAFNRTYDVGGLNHWTGQLVNGTMTPETVAEKFFTYPEMLEKGYSNAEYVKVLYRSFLDREPDPLGYSYHLNRLNSGVSRVTVLYGFSRSAEFKRLIG